MQIPRSVVAGAAVGTAGLLAVGALEAKPAKAQSPIQAPTRDGVADGAIYGALMGAFVFGVGAIPGAIIGGLVDAAMIDQKPSKFDGYWHVN